MPNAVPLVRVVRSDLTESIHVGHVAVCDPSGRLVAAAGDPDRLLFARSSMKPLQAAVSLRHIGEPPPTELVAVMCASHNGEPVHVRTVRRLLRSGGVSERRLACPPVFPPARRNVRRHADAEAAANHAARPAANSRDQTWSRSIRGRGPFMALDSSAPPFMAG